MIEVLKKLPIVGTIISNLQTLLICAAVLIVTNGATGLFAYVKGHNAAAAKCKINSVIRERDEARRDRDNAVSTSKFLKDQLDRIGTDEAGRNKKDAEDAANTKPIDGCVIDAVPSRVRKRGPRK